MSKPIEQKVGVASGARDGREIACLWAGSVWTMLLTIELGACLGLAGSFCNTLQITCALSKVTTEKAL
jgi:hypothetical protein